MMPRCVCIVLTGIVLIATKPTGIRAEDLSTLSIRYMTIEADVIVVGEPHVSETSVLPSKYKVSDVLKGPASLASHEVILIIGKDLYSLSSPYFLPVEEAKKPPPPHITKALLFLKIPPEDRNIEGYYPVLSGIRALTKKGDVLVPQQFTNPGPMYLQPMKDPNWAAMVAEVRADLPKIERILELGRITDNARRNQAIFKWIEKHKDEFGGGFFVGTGRKGWASLEGKLFEWVMESCIPDDCWRAVELAEELKTIAAGNFPSFCSPRGRKLLVDKALDSKLPNSLRLGALRRLGYGNSFWWNAYNNPYHGTSVVTRDEQRTIINRIVPLLRHEDAPWRAAAVHCLMSVSWSHSLNFKQISKQAVPHLVDLYRGEKYGFVRHELVHAIRRIEDEAFWQELTGNPHGIAVIVRPGRIYRDELKCDLNLEYTRAKIKEVPTFRLERLSEDGKVLQLLMLKPTDSYTKDLFTKGWYGQGMVHMTIPASEIEPGTWRVTVEGQIGEDTWRSEQVEFTVPDK